MNDSLSLKVLRLSVMKQPEQCRPIVRPEESRRDGNEASGIAERIHKSMIARRVI